MRRVSGEGRWLGGTGLARAAGSQNTADSCCGPSGPVGARELYLFRMARCRRIPDNLRNELVGGRREGLGGRGGGSHIPSRFCCCTRGDLPSHRPGRRSAAVILLIVGTSEGRDIDEAIV